MTSVVFINSFHAKYSGLLWIRLSYVETTGKWAGDDIRNHMLHSFMDVVIVVYKHFMAVKPSSKATPSSQVPRSTGDTQKDRTLAHLLEMGFDCDSSIEALEATGYDLAKASAMLAQQSMDLSRTPTKDTVEFMEDAGAGCEPAAKRKDRGYMFHGVCVLLCVSSIPLLYLALGS